MKPQLPKKPPHKPEMMTLEQVFGYLARSTVQIELAENTLAIRDTHPEETPEWLAVAIAHHEAALVTILKTRTLFRAIDERTCLMRFENPPRGTREAGLRYLGKMLADFEALCDLPEGYTDPGDIFTDCALDTLQGEYEELTRPDAPYPIPKDDPRERYPNGKLFTD